MTDERYNGWTNYETWAAALWIDNDQEAYNHARGLAQDVRNAGPQPLPGVDFQREPVNILADQLQDWIEGLAPDLSASLFSDLLTRAIARVNWRELAEYYLIEG